MMRPWFVCGILKNAKPLFERTARERKFLGESQALESQGDGKSVL